MEKPIIAVSSMSPGDRLRFSVAHELGHLVLHRFPNQKPSVLEKEAHMFAGEFLLPSEAMMFEYPPTVTLTGLMELKLRWGVSIQALVVRAKELNIITRHDEQHLFQQIGQRGWRTHEPAELDIPAERPRLLRQMAEMVYGGSLDFDRIGSEMKLSPRFVESVIEAHEGGAVSTFGVDFRPPKADVTPISSRRSNEAASD